MTRAAAALEMAAIEGNKRATPVTACDPVTPTSRRAQYGFRDVRDVLRARLARETAARVAAGGVARAFLREPRDRGLSFTARWWRVIDPANSPARATQADDSPLRCPDPDAEGRDDRRIDEARSAGDTSWASSRSSSRASERTRSYVHWDQPPRCGAAPGMSLNSSRASSSARVRADTAASARGHAVIEGRGEDGRWVHRTNNAAA